MKSQEGWGVRHQRKLQEYVCVALSSLPTLEWQPNVCHMGTKAIAYAPSSCAHPFTYLTQFPPHPPFRKLGCFVSQFSPSLRSHVATSAVMRGESLLTRSPPLPLPSPGTLSSCATTEPGQKLIRGRLPFLLPPHFLAFTSPFPPA